ncbi:MAG: hypothetical protein SNJ70_01760 [Armatimonadota bacterium]
MIIEDLIVGFRTDDGYGYDFCEVDKYNTNYLIKGALGEKIYASEDISIAVHYGALDRFTYSFSPMTLLHFVIYPSYVRNIFFGGQYNTDPMSIESFAGYVVQSTNSTYRKPFYAKFGLFVYTTSTNTTNIFDYYNFTINTNIRNANIYNANCTYYRKEYGSDWISSSLNIGQDGFTISLDDFGYGIFEVYFDVGDLDYFAVDFTM